MKRFKTGIGTKILFALLWLSIISLVLFAYVTFSGMKGLGRYALESNTSLGDQAVGDSIKALEDQAEEYLLRLVKDQAALSGVLLEKIETEVNIVTAFASNLWENPEGHGRRHSYSQEEKPDDIYAVSVYKLAPKVDLNAVRKEVDLSSHMDDIFIPVFKSDPNMDTICMGMESGIFRSYPWRGGRDPSYDPRKRSWYRRAAEEGKVIWSKPYIHAATKELIITCAKPFYTPDRKLLGVVEADVTLKVMSDKIVGTQIGKLGYAFLLDNHGKVITRPGLTPGDTRWDETYNTENLLESDNPELKKIVKDMIAGNTGIGRTKFDGGDKYIAYGPVKGMNWSLGIAVPVKQIIAPASATEKKIIYATEKACMHINERIKSVHSTILIIFLCIICSVFFVAYRLSRRITRPILALSDGVKIVGGGNLDYKLEVKTGDEIEDLADSFNEMVANLKAKSDELKQSHDVLETRVQERTKELAEANDQLKELDRLKSMFIATMSHELRTPLNSIIGFTGIILQGMSGEVTEEQKKQLTMVKNSGSHLLALIDDIIDASKIEAGKVELAIEEFNLSTLVREVKDSSSVRATEKGLETFLEMPEVLTIESDQRRAKQVIVNLVNNAVKFTHKGEIRIKVAEKDGMAEVSIADTGIGIKKEEMGKLFKAFSRILTEGIPKEEGTGIGLHLSRKITELLGGEISAESEFGKGSRFKLTLPLKYKGAKA